MVEYIDGPPRVTERSYRDGKLDVYFLCIWTVGAEGIIHVKVSSTSLSVVANIATPYTLVVEVNAQSPHDNKDFINAVDDLTKTILSQLYEWEWMSEGVAYYLHTDNHYKYLTYCQPFDFIYRVVIIRPEELWDTIAKFIDDKLSPTIPQTPQPYQLSISITPYSFGRERIIYTEIDEKGKQELLEEMKDWTREKWINFLKTLIIVSESYTQTRTGEIIRKYLEGKYIDFPFVIKVEVE